MRSHRGTHRAASVLAVLLAAAGSSAQPAPAVRIATPAEVKAVHAGAASPPLPQDARDLRFDDRQAVTVPGAPPLTLVPVSFKQPMKDPVVEGQTLSLCGILLAAPSDVKKLLVTVGTGNTEMMSCTGLKAIGGAPASSSGQRPRLILIYDTYTGQQSQAATILLVWDKDAGAYKVDDQLSEWLGQQPSGRTVAGARRLLATKQKAPNGTAP